MRWKAPAGAIGMELVLIAAIVWFAVHGDWATARALGTLPMAVLALLLGLGADIAMLRLAARSRVRRRPTDYL